VTAIVDTGIIFAFYSLGDKYHYDSLGLIAHLIEGKWGKPFITNHILDESLNILKYRIGWRTAEAFLETFIDSNLLQIIYTDSDLEHDSINIFRRNIDRRGLSYTDVVTITCINIFKINFLISYDIRSFKGFVKNIIGPHYWETLSREERQRILDIVRKI